MIGSMVLSGNLWSVQGNAARWTVGDFSWQRLEGWQRKSLHGENQWRFESTSREVATGGGHLRVTSENAAEMMLRKETIDLKKWPILHWSWKIELPLPEHDEQSREGDDFAARVGIIVADGPFFWQTRSINYVHSSRLPEGSSWANPYSDQVQMLVVHDDHTQTKGWQHFTRPVAQDFKRLFNEEIQTIHAVAIMVDTDNRHGQARTWFGDIYFSDQ
ncbi:MAG: DUF3047 domain-containing protein [Magnetococcales bacterium]|nr:DUF3047 domain-containing protein [Magnetococcales bacterium]